MNELTKRKPMKAYLVNCCWSASFNKQFIIDAVDEDEDWSKACDEMISYYSDERTKENPFVNINIVEDVYGRAGWGNPENFEVFADFDNTEVLREFTY